MTGRQPRVTWLRAGLLVLATLISGAVGAQARLLAMRTAVPPRTRLACTCGVINTIAVDSRTGRVFVVHPYGSPGVSVLAAQSGALLRTISVDGVPTTVAVDEPTGRAFIGTERVVSMVDTRSAALVRTVHERADAIAVAPRTGWAFAAAITGRLLVLDARRGALVRTVAIGQHVWAVVVDEQTARVFVATQGPSSHGLLVNSQGNVNVLDGRSGVVLRTVALARGQYPVAAAGDVQTGRVFVVVQGRGGEGVSMLDARDGAILRTVAVGAYPDAVATDARAGRVFVTDMMSGTVSVLDARSGIVLRTVAVGRSPEGLAVDSQTERVFVANVDANTVSMLDARSGALLRTITAGHRPSEVAVDARLGRVFVADQIDNGVSVLDATSGQVLRTTR
jgi:YVTN family beta-propeller protein